MKQKIQSTNGITEGVIWKPLLAFFFPILFGAFFQQLYNTTDTVIVGHFVGKQGLAAVGSGTGAIINVLVGAFIGLSSGATVTISQYYGANKKRQVSKAVHTAVAFSLVASVVMMALGLLLSPHMLKAMGTPDDVMEYATSYLRIYFLGMPANLVYNMSSGILRAIGDSKRPLYALMFACLTNILLDLLFVVIFGWGVVGVAVATIAAQYVSALIVLYCLMKTRKSYRFMIKYLGFHKESLLRMLRIGLPAALQSTMYTSSNVLIQSTINTFGTTVVAAFTAYSKIDGLYWMIVNAYGVSITTFSGQNYGAGKMDRIKKGSFVCLGMAFVTTVILSVTFYTQGGYLLRLFTTDTDVIEVGMQILTFLTPTYVTYICVEVYSGTLRGTGNSFAPMLMTCLGVCVLRAVWLLIAVPIWPRLEMVLFSFPLAWSVTTIIFLIYFFGFSQFRVRKGR